MSYEQGAYRARYAGMVCAVDSGMQSWTLAAEPQLVSSEGSRQAERTKVAAASPTAVPPPVPQAVSAPPDAQAPSTMAENNVAPPQPASFAGPSDDALKARLIQVFVALAYMAQDDSRPQARAYKAGLRAFLQDERLNESTPLGTLVDRAEAAQKRSETALQGPCKPSVQAAVVVCGKRS